MGARVSLSTRLSFGFGAVAYGIKDNGFSVFLLIFYNQVVGLPAGQVGIAIMAALIIDGFLDPAIGALSDRTNSRWGRRHPWMYASILPIMISWVLLWHPPEGAPGMQFAYLIAIAVFVRFSLACNEVPSLAVVPEMTMDYHERTSILRYRYLFGWIGGLAMLILAYGVLLRPEDGRAGQLQAAGYSTFAWIGAGFMGLSVLVSALGTHRLLAHRTPHPEPKETVPQILRGMASTLSNRPFLWLMSAGVFAFAGQGLSFAMSNYLLGYIWRFTGPDFLLYAGGLFSGVVLSFLTVNTVARRIGKKEGAALFSVMAVLIGTIPYWLRAMDMFPEPGSPMLVPLFIAIVSLATAPAVSIFILTASMMADVVEASQVTTGKREEGLFTAGYFFMQKAVTGIGIFLSGLMLSLVGFPASAVPGQVDIAVLDRLALIFASVTVVLGLISALLYLRFPIGREEHDAQLRALAAASDT